MMKIPCAPAPRTICAPAVLAALLLAAAFAGAAPDDANRATVPLWVGTVSETDEAREFRLHLRGQTPQASWENADRACAVLEVTVDGEYDQHIFLAAGDEWADYDCIVGPVPPGRHEIRLSWMRDWTPDLTQAPQLRDVALQPLPRTDPALEPALRAPCLWLRADTVGRFSDVPLVLYWERTRGAGGPGILYTIILTNEDGGTNTERLMARWGRTTDIEWCYAHAPSGEVHGEGVYQGRGHETLPFRGRYDGEHPNLYDVTVNNVFSDTPSGVQKVRVRPFPVHADLSRSTRESVMDRFPWLYRVMAAEMEREGKIESPADPATAAVSDLRNYVYVEVCAEQRGTELRFEAQLNGSDRWFSSDHLDPKARIERTGCFRSSIELPAGTSAREIRALRLQCLPASPADGRTPVQNPRAIVRSVDRVFMLGPDYRPGPGVLALRAPASLKPGRSVTVRAPANPPPELSR